MGPRRSSQRSKAVVKDDGSVEEEAPKTNVFSLSQHQHQNGGEPDAPTSQVVQNTQEIHSVKPSELDKLNSLDKAQREKALKDLTRLILFKGLAGEAIDRAKCVKEANLPDRVTSAAFDEANRRLQNMFDFELKRIPAWMENMKDLAKSKKERYYLVNSMEDEESGEHSKAIHAVHEDVSIDKGLLMVVLALCYCDGEPKGDGSRWIRDDHLYEHLHRLDENIPAVPPNEGKSNGSTRSNPNVDAALQRFVQMDYLLKDKDKEKELTTYCLGPRAAMEIGRKQIILFCSDVLDQDPDPSMLLEVEGQDDMEME